MNHLAGHGTAGQDECVFGYMCGDPETQANSASLDWMEPIRGAFIPLFIKVLISVIFDSTGCTLSCILSASWWLEWKLLVGL
jgi:hypothetical protein